MQTELVTLTDEEWTELLSNGGVAVLSDATDELCFAVGTAMPTLDAAAHRISPQELHSLTSFGDIPTDTKAFIRAARGIQSVVVSR